MIKMSFTSLCLLQVQRFDNIVVKFDQGLRFPSVEYVQGRIMEEMNDGKEIYLSVSFWLDFHRMLFLLKRIAWTVNVP